MSTKLVKSGVLVSLGKIVTPDNFAALLASPRIKRLAGSIRSVTQIAPIVLEKVGDSYRLWAGHDRMAAVTMAGKTTIRADVRTGTEGDFLLLQMAENESRRHLAELAEKFDAVTQGAVGTSADHVPTGPEQPRVVTQTKAKVRNRAVAEARGVTVAAEKKRRQRVAARQVHDEAAPDTEHPSAPVDTGPNPAPPVVLLGLARSAAPDAFVVPVQLAIDEADKHLRLAQVALGRLEREPAFPNALAQQLRAEAHRLASNVRAARPASVCPWCKRDAALMPQCAPCSGSGFVGAEVAARAPKELLDSENPVKAFNGRFVPLDQAVHVAKGAAPPKAKRMRIEDDAGTELHPDPVFVPDGVPMADEGGMDDETIPF